jgi:NAD dependent epimerase/dehydratase family enzyme
MSWITPDDVAGTVLHCLMHEDLSGPVNVTSPEPVTNAEFTKTLGRVLGRPTILPMPGFAARAAFGEMADEMLLGGQRVVPQRLTQSGYAFRFPDLEAALRHVLGRTDRQVHE